MYTRFHKPKIILKKGDWARIKKITESGWVANGKYVGELENEFKKLFKNKYAIACSSCTQGLIIALKAAGFKNKKIALPSFTWPSTLYAIECSGNIPVFCDIHKETWLPIFNKKCDVLMGVDIFGNQLEIKTNKPLIIDAAHSFGLKKLGQRGLIEVVSLSFTKIVTAMQGGMILTNSKQIYEKAVKLRDLSAKMCEINALIGLNSLKNYSQRLSEIEKAIQLYRNNIKIPFREQKIVSDSNHSVYAIVLESKQVRDKIANLFTKNNIEVKIYYEPLVKGLPNTDWLFSRIIALPTYKEIIPQIPKICHLINKAIS